MTSVRNGSPLGDYLGAASSSSAVELSGLGGDDVLVGSRFADLLRGGAGWDLISGGLGNDTIDGGAGVDLAFGGAGADRFVFRPGDLALGTRAPLLIDTIGDFEGAGRSGGDAIRVEGFAAGTTLSFQGYGLTRAIQFYRIDDPTTAGADGWIRIVMADGTRTLGSGDVEFVPASPPPSPPVNRAPTDLAISAATLAENAPADTLVGTLSGTDPDTGDTLSFRLVNDANGAFRLDGNRLLATRPFDFEAALAPTIRVEVRDAAGLAYEEDFAITVANVNEAPTAIALSAASLAENAPASTAIGSLSALDPDAGDTLSFRLVSDFSGAFALASDGVTLVSTRAFDFEAGEAPTIRVEVADAAGLTREQDFALTIANVNEAPTSIALSAASLAENAPAGTAIGSLSALDPDAGDTLSFRLVSDFAGAFALASDGVTLVSTRAFNFEAGEAPTIRVEVRDAAGLTREQDFAVTITDVNEPVAASGETYAVTEDQALVVAADLGLLANDQAPDGGLVVAATSVGTFATQRGGSFTLAADGSFRYVPAADFNGQDSFAYTITDRNGSTATATATFDVANVPEPARTANETYAATEDLAFVRTASQGLLANGDTPEGGVVTTTGTIATTNGSIAVAADGSFTYTPRANYFGTDSFTYGVRGNDGSTATSTATFDVAGTDDPVVVLETLGLLGRAAIDEIPLSSFLAVTSAPDGGVTLTRFGLGSSPPQTPPVGNFLTFDDARDVLILNRGAPVPLNQTFKATAWYELRDVDGDTAFGFFAYFIGL